MNIFTEHYTAYYHIKIWNYSHPSGFAGRVSEMYFKSTGSLYCRQFSVDGKVHRPAADGPAYESFYESGKLRYRQFSVNGKEVFP